MLLDNVEPNFTQNEKHKWLEFDYSGISEERHQAVLSRCYERGAGFRQLRANIIGKARTLAVNQQNYTLIKDRYRFTITDEVMQACLLDLLNKKQ